MAISMTASYKSNPQDRSQGYFDNGYTGAVAFFPSDGAMVPIDKCDRLTELVAQAREFRELPFDEKLAKITELAANSMRNAWALHSENVKAEKEVFMSPQGEFGDIVFKDHPLSYALNRNAGCCRYQATLFFILAYEANLGIKQYLQSMPIGGGARTCFNDVIGPNGQVHHVSVFKESLTPDQQGYDYTTRLSADAFDKPIKQKPGELFFSCHYYKKKLQITFGLGKHVTEAIEEETSAARDAGGSA